MSPVSLFDTQNQVVLEAPRTQLLDHSLLVTTSANKQFTDWTPLDHAYSYHCMHRVAQAWESNNVTDQYLIYGKSDSNPLNWEMVPYQKCRTIFGRIFQQLQVLWRSVFGGVAVSKAQAVNRVMKYEELLKNEPKAPSKLPSKGDDAFCKDETIDRQWVITGNKVNVLFNYAPIGFGGERLHFLVVPKAHRETFTDVTEEEYCESLYLTAKLVTHFTDTRQNVKNVYLLNKTGIDAGQTVKHWHLHVIFSTNAAQDFWGKLTVIKNIFFGSSPMNKGELAKKVSDFRDELASLKA